MVGRMTRGGDGIIAVVARACVHVEKYFLLTVIPQAAGMDGMLGVFLET